MEEILNLWFYLLKINRKIKKYILSQDINPYVLYKMNHSELIGLGLDMALADFIVKAKDLTEAKAIYEYIKKKNIGFTSINENTYPDCLRNIPDSPIGLFYIGNIMLPMNTLAIVGSRRATNYGKTMAFKLSHEVASKGIAIVSGMAKGIDTEAHKGALEANGVTIAVLGSGFKNIYPKENIGLMNKIIDKGCVLTEYPPDMKPFSYNFPERNRIISGLSKGILVVEAGLNSGSMITVNSALEQGRDVYAVPGDIYRETSKGVNKLIKEGAKLIDSSQDILEEYGIFTTDELYTIELDNEEKIIIESISQGNISFEHIKLKTSLETSLLLSKLTLLECKGFIKKSYGGNYILIKA